MLVHLHIQREKIVLRGSRAGRRTRCCLQNIQDDKHTRTRKPHSSRLVKISDQILVCNSNHSMKTHLPSSNCMSYNNFTIDRTRVGPGTHLCKSRPGQCTDFWDNVHNHWHLDLKITLLYSSNRQCSHPTIPRWRMGAPTKG
jgi:hypothetical protein